MLSTWRKIIFIARDAHTGGDPVAAENYLQHAEHYFRIIAAGQPAQAMALEPVRRVRPAKATSTISMTTTTTARCRIGSPRPPNARPRRSRSSRAPFRASRARRTRRSLFSSGRLSIPSGKARTTGADISRARTGRTTVFRTAARARTGRSEIAATDIETTGRIAMAGRAISARIESPDRNHSLPARTRPRRSAPRRCRPS